MNDKLDFYVRIRGIISYINDEIDNIPTSPKTKEQVQSICETISSEVLGKLCEDDDEILMANLDQQLNKFHLLIKKLDKDEKERMANLLLITHVGDILNLMKQEKQ